MLENSSAKDNILNLVREKQKIISRYKESVDKNDDNDVHIESINDIKADASAIFDNICHYYIDIISNDTFEHELSDVRDDTNPATALNEFDAVILEFIVFYTSWINTSNATPDEKIRLQLKLLDKSIDVIHTTSEIAQKHLREKNFNTKSDLYILYAISASDFSKNVIHADTYLPDDGELNHKTVELHKTIIQILKYAFKLSPSRHDERFIEDSIREQYNCIRIIDPESYQKLRKSDPEHSPKTRILPIITIILAIAAIILYFFSR